MNNLKRLRLRGNDIVQITKGTFAGLSNLTLLDLEGTKVNKIEPSSFADLGSLETLLVQRNDLSKVVSVSNVASGKLLEGLGSLRNIRLDNCGIESVHPDTFLLKNVPSLKAINLDDNLITSFQGGEFRELEDLKFLGLGSNRIRGLVQSSGFKCAWRLYGSMLPR